MGLWVLLVAHVSETLLGEALWDARLAIHSTCYASGAGFSPRAPQGQLGPKREGRTMHESIGAKSFRRDLGGP